jgi:hypothetical protein
MTHLTLAEKIILGFTVTAAISNLLLIILFAVRLKYRVTSAPNTSPTFTIVENKNCPNDLTTAITDPISLNYSNGGAGLYTLALISFILSFAVAILVVQKTPSSLK